MKENLFTSTLFFLLASFLAHSSPAQLPKLKFYRYQPTTSTENYGSPSISCEELISTVESNLRKKGSVHQLQLIDSSWLESVDGYDYEGKVMVIAKIKRKQDFFGKKYIFCSIPRSNWDYFFNSFSDLSKSYGERFHKAIIDYQCDCD